MKEVERDMARKMRAGGSSLRDIERKLGVARSSVSRWVRDIELTEEHRRILVEKSKAWGGQHLGAKRNHALAVARRAESRKKGFKRAEKDCAFRVICALYWGEGSKGTKDGVSISNADVDVVRVWGQWLKNEGYEGSMSFRVCYYGENGVSEDEIRRWWMEKMPFIGMNHMRKFTRCVINRASQRKKIGKLPYGTGMLRVGRTDVWEEIMGGIDWMRKNGV